MKILAWLQAAILITLFSSLAKCAHAATGTATLGQPVNISVSSDGTPPLRYQWYKDGKPVAGATSATYTIASATLADAGAYTAVVANDWGGTTSDIATLTVKGLPPTKATTTITLNIALDLSITTAIAQH